MLTTAPASSLGVPAKLFHRTCMLLNLFDDKPDLLILRAKAASKVTSLHEIAWLMLSSVKQNGLCTASCDYTFLAL